MSRLTIDVTAQQHQALKALAALEGKSIRQYALERLLPSDEHVAMQELKSLLQSRLVAAELAACHGIYKDWGAVLTGLRVKAWGAILCFAW
jgi:Antitoxin ParD